jgi:type I restriction enzyme S subunit
MNADALIEGSINNWKETTLGKLITLHYGKALKTEHRLKGDIPVYSSAGLTGNHNEALIDGKGIVVGRKGTVGKAYLTELPFWCIDTAYYILPDDQKYEFKYLYYLLRTLGLEELNEDSAVPGLNRDTAYQQQFLLPPLPEQKAIANVLSSLDDKIDLLHRQNKTLEAMAETLFRQWFIEEAKDDWEDGVLNDEFDFIMGQSPSGSSFNDDGNGVPMFQGNADFGFRFPKERVFTTEPTRFARKLDTLISVRAPVGAQNMAHKECCIGRGVAAFRYKSNNEYYTYTYFKLRSLMEEIKQFNNEGTVFGSISKSDFEGIITTIPSNEIVVKFEKEVKPINDKIITNCYQLQTLEKLRDNLLPKLMSGEVRVSYEQQDAA